MAVSYPDVSVAAARGVEKFEVAGAAQVNDVTEPGEDVVRRVRQHLHRVEQHLHTSWHFLSTIPILLHS